MGDKNGNTGGINRDSRAHNPKVVGSNPSPATKYIKDLAHFELSAFFVGSIAGA